MVTELCRKTIRRPWTPSMCQHLCGSRLLSCPCRGSMQRATRMPSTSEHHQVSTLPCAGACHCLLMVLPTRTTMSSVRIALRCPGLPPPLKSCWVEGRQVHMRTAAVGDEASQRLACCKAVQDAPACRPGLGRYVLSVSVPGTRQKSMSFCELSDGGRPQLCHSSSCSRRSSCPRKAGAPAAVTAGNEGPGGARHCANDGHAVLRQGSEAGLPRLHSCAGQVAGQRSCRGLRAGLVRHCWRCIMSPDAGRCRSLDAQMVQSAPCREQAVKASQASTGGTARLMTTPRAQQPAEAGPLQLGRWLQQHPDLAGCRLAHRPDVPGAPAACRTWPRLRAHPAGPEEEGGCLRPPRCSTCRPGAQKPLDWWARLRRGRGAEHLLQPPGRQRRTSTPPGPHTVLVGVAHEEAVGGQRVVSLQHDAVAQLSDDGRHARQPLRGLASPGPHGQDRF